MRSFLGFALFATLGRTLQLPEVDHEPRYIVANPAPGSVEALDHRIPTSYESAVMGRRILALTPLGTLSTVFPASSTSEDSGSSDEHRVSVTERRPGDIGGLPVGLMDYIADCEDTGNPTILSIKIATSFKNVRQGSNITLSMHWTPPYPPDERIGAFAFSDNPSSHVQTSYSAANQPRFSLLGYLEPIPDANEKGSDVAKCFVATHPDSKYWLPGNRIHESEFVRLVVTHVYWIGGFGDRAYIGWIPEAEWHNVTVEEWKRIELHGEKKGWKEWSAAAGSASYEGCQLHRFSHQHVEYRLALIGSIGVLVFCIARMVKAMFFKGKKQEYREAKG